MRGTRVQSETNVGPGVRRSWWRGMDGPQSPACILRGFQLFLSCFASISLYISIILLLFILVYTHKKIYSFMHIYINICIYIYIFRFIVLTKFWLYSTLNNISHNFYNIYVKNKYIFFFYKDEKYRSRNTSIKIYKLQCLRTPNFFY